MRVYMQSCVLVSSIICVSSISVLYWTPHIITFTNNIEGQSKQSDVEYPNNSFPVANNRYGRWLDPSILDFSLDIVIV